MKNNPQMEKAWEIAQQMAQNPNKEQIVQQLAQQKGMSVEQVKQEASKFGINL